MRIKNKTYYTNLDREICKGNKIIGVDLRARKFKKFYERHPLLSGAIGAGLVYIILVMIFA